MIGIKLVEISELIGKTLVRIDRFTDALYFYTADGNQYKMYHKNHCCEIVFLEDICGDLNYLLGNPILLAEERTNRDDEPPKGNEDSSYTWTFYEIATILGSVTIRWFGSSNGYYSESVDFELIS